MHSLWTAGMPFVELGHVTDFEITNIGAEQLYSASRKLGDSLGSTKCDILGMDKHE